MTNEDPLQVILSDSQTQIRAKISTAATAAFLRQHRRPLVETSAGGLINIHNFEIVATNLGPSDERVSLLIKEFDWVWSGSPPESDHLKHVHNREHVAKFLEDLDIMRKQQTPATPKPAGSTETARQRQGMRAPQTSQHVRFEEPDIEKNSNETTLMSQTPFATQLRREGQPAQMQSSDARLQDGVNLSRPTAAGRSLQATDANARANQIPPHLSKMLNLIHKPLSREGQPSSVESETAVAPVSASRPTTITGDSSDIVGSTKVNDKQSVSDETSALDMQSRDTESDHGSQIEDEVEPSAVEQLPIQLGSQARRDHDDVQDQNIGQKDQARRPEGNRSQGLKGAATRPSPAQIFSRNRAGESRTVCTMMLSIQTTTLTCHQPLVEITRLICKIPKEQTNLLEKPSCKYIDRIFASGFVN